MKAEFNQKQPAVRWQELSNGLVDVAICVNEKIVTELSYDNNDSQTYFQYDFNQFRENVLKIDKTKVEQNPVSYLDYIPQNGETLVEKVNRQNDEIEMLTGCILDISEVVYA